MKFAENDSYFGIRLALSNRCTFVPLEFLWTSIAQAGCGSRWLGAKVQSCVATLIPHKSSDRKWAKEECTWFCDIVYAYGV